MKTTAGIEVNGDRLARLAAEAAADKSGSDTVIIQVGEVLAICDLFVITSGANDRQVRTIADEVETRITAAGGPKPLRIEGLDDARWVLLDYGDVAVHVFLEETRRYYELERLWSDAPRLDTGLDRELDRGLGGAGGPPDGAMASNA